MSHGAAYGDDSQTDTNYPLVRITNLKSNLVYYCRTHDHSSVTVQSPLVSYTFFDVPINVELGPSVLEVVASGINSFPLQINVISSCLPSFQESSPTTTSPSIIESSSPTIEPSLMR